MSLISLQGLCDDGQALAAIRLISLLGIQRVRFELHSERAKITSRAPAKYSPVGLYLSVISRRVGRDPGANIPISCQRPESVVMLR